MWVTGNTIYGSKVTLNLQHAISFMDTQRGVGGTRIDMMPATVVEFATEGETAFAGHHADRIRKALFAYYPTQHLDLTEDLM